MEASMYSQRLQISIITTLNSRYEICAHLISFSHLNLVSITFLMAVKMLQFTRLRVSNECTEKKIII